MATAKVPDHMSSWPDLPTALMLVSAEDAYTQPRPSIKNFVEDLEYTWGNSEEWVLELRDGRQIAFSLSL